MVRMFGGCYYWSLALALASCLATTQAQQTNNCYPVKVTIKDGVAQECLTADTRKMSARVSAAIANTQRFTTTQQSTTSPVWRETLDLGCQDPLASLEILLINAANGQACIKWTIPDWKDAALNPFASSSNRVVGGQYQTRRQVQEAVEENFPVSESIVTSSESGDDSSQLVFTSLTDTGGSVSYAVTSRSGKSSLNFDVVVTNILPKATTSSGVAAKVAAKDATTDGDSSSSSATTKFFNSLPNIKLSPFMTIVASVVVSLVVVGLVLGTKALITRRMKRQGGGSSNKRPRQEGGVATTTNGGGDSNNDNYNNNDPIEPEETSVVEHLGGGGDDGDEEAPPPQSTQSKAFAPNATRKLETTISAEPSPIPTKTKTFLPWRTTKKPAPTIQNEDEVGFDIYARKSSGFEGSPRVKGSPFDKYY